MKLPAYVIHHQKDILMLAFAFLACFSFANCTNREPEDDDNEIIRRFFRPKKCNIEAICQTQIYIQSQSKNQFYVQRVQHDRRGGKSPH